MKKQPKSLEYMVGSSAYSISFSNLQQIVIIIQDMDQKIKYQLILTNELLLKKQSNVLQLYNQIYCQYIYDNHIPTKLLQYNNTQISILFNYPTSPKIKRFTFSCQPIFLSEKQIHTDVKQFVQTANRFEQNYRKFESQIDELISGKINQASSKLQAKLNVIACSLESKMLQFQQYYQNKQSQRRKSHQQVLDNSMRRIAQNNKLLIKQLNFVKMSLEEDIMILNQNLITENRRVDCLEKEVELNKENHQEALIDVKNEIESVHLGVLQKILQLNKQIKKQKQNQQNITKAVQIIQVNLSNLNQQGPIFKSSQFQEYKDQYKQNSLLRNLKREISVQQSQQIKDYTSFNFWVFHL